MTTPDPVAAMQAAFAEIDLSRCSEDQLIQMSAALRELEQKLNVWLGGKGTRKQEVPEAVIDRARGLLAEEDPERNYTHGYKYTHAEIAKMLGISASTLSHRLENDGPGTIAYLRRQAAGKQRKRRRK